MSDFLQPLEIYRITSPYGWRVRNGVREFHSGIDLSSGLHALVYVAFDCTVYDCGFSSSYGWRFWGIIQVGEFTGKYIVLAHLALVGAFAVNSKLQAGTLIGLQGSSGISSASHVHMGIYDSPVAGAKSYDFSNLLKN